MAKLVIDFLKMSWLQSEGTYHKELTTSHLNRNNYGTSSLSALVSDILSNSSHK